MKRRTWGITDKGLKREGNQDSYLVEDRLGLYIVADGVGGWADRGVDPAEYSKGLIKK